MEVATTAQPSSGHQKRYVPIVAGTLGGFGMALIVGFLFYISRRRSFGIRGPVRAKGSEPQTYRDGRQLFGFENTGHLAHTRAAIRTQRLELSPLSGAASCHSYQGEPPHAPSVPEVSESVPDFGSLFNIDVETGFPWDLDSNLDPSGLGALPFANVDFGTNFDLDHQNSNASTVPVSSYLKPSREEETPFDIGLELGGRVDEDLNA